MKSAAKTVFYNILVFFTLFNVLYWCIPLVALVQSMFGRNSADGEALYRSFIEWRSRPMQTQYGVVEGPYLQRRTILTPSASSRQVYFFGGSTMWGIGADDAGTIPSQYAALAGAKAENFAEIGWTAHQSLLYLIQILQDGNRPDVVVFYDGVNDVSSKCRVEHGPTSHGKEQEFASLLMGNDRPDSFSSYFRGVFRLTEKIKREVSRSAAISPYDCDTNPAKAEAIAANLVRDWQFAKAIVELHGGHFVGILQPVAYFSHTRVDTATLPTELGRQFTAIYPLIRKKMAEESLLYDFGAVLDVDESLYYDFCHINARGNAYVARKVADVIDSH